MANKTTNHNINVDKFRKAILNWYDKHQRTLPWRALSNQTPNPYHVWLSEIMLQQTTVPTVGPYFEKFLNKWPTIHDLANAHQDEVTHEWAGLGYYARARNLHKCAITVSNELGGEFPQEQVELEKLSGIGGYTSAAIRAIAFNKPANVVDGNIERIMSRIFAITEPMPDSKKDLHNMAGLLADDRKDRPGDYAQALMDIGSSICIPKNPRCALCPVTDFCEAKKLGIAGELPKKKPKKVKPEKMGHVYWLTNDKQEVAFVRRDEKEMLGGMLGLPTSEWVLTSDEAIIPLTHAQDSKQHISHSFTHFNLRLDIYIAHAQEGIIKALDNVKWVSRSELSEIGIPTLFKKVVKLMK